MMKYMQLEYAGYIIFDQSQKHSDMAKKFPNDKVKSAGFVSGVIEPNQINCHGESNSLRISSKEIDSEMIGRRLSVYC